MSDTKVKIIDIQVRYKDAVDGIAQYRTAIAEAQKIQKDLKQELKDGKITQEEYDKAMASSVVYIRQQNEAMRTLQNQVNNQIKSTKEQEGSLKQLRAELSNATAAYDAMSRAERESASGMELRNHINEITKELKGAEESTMRFYRNVGNYPETQGLEGISARIEGIGKTIASAFSVGAITAFGQKVVEVGRSFDDAMARVHAVTQANVEDMNMMREAAKQWGDTTAYSRTEAANALEMLTRNGLTAAEATNALGPTLQFAQANTIGLAEAADIMTNVTNGFNLGVGEMGKVSDSLAWSASHSASNVEQFAEALKNAAPFGAALGQPIEEVNASLGTLADIGIKASDAGTALRMIMLGLATSTTKQEAVFKKYGIQIDENTIKADGFTKTLEKLKTSGIMESKNRMNELADVFGRKVAPQAFELMNQVDSVREKLDGLKNSAGTTADMFKVSMSDVTVAAKELESAWEGVLGTIYDNVKGSMVEPMYMVNDALLFVRDHISEVGNFIITLLASISFAKLVNEAKASFTTIRNSAVTNAESASATVKTLQQQEIALRKSVANQTVEIENTSGTERKMIEAKLLANKRELANTEKALVKAKASEIQLWEQAAALNSASTWKSAMTACSVAVKGFVTASKTALKGFVFTAIIMLAFEAIQKLFSLIDTSSGSTFGKITSAVTGFIKKGLQLLIDAVKSVVAWFTDFTENSRLMQVALVGLKTNMNILGVVFKTVWTIFKTGLKNIAALFKGLISIVGGVATALEGLFTLNWNNVKKGIEQVGTAVTNFWKDIKSNAKDAKTEVINNTKTAVKNIKEAVEDASVSKAFGGTNKDKATLQIRRRDEHAEDEYNKKVKELADERNEIYEEETENYKKLSDDEILAREQKMAAIDDEIKKLKEKRNAEREEEKNTFDERVYDRTMELDGNPVEKGKTITITNPKSTPSKSTPVATPTENEKNAPSGGGGGVSTDSKDADKAEKAAKKRAEAEMKAMQEAEQSMLDLMEDTAQKRKMQLEKQYNDEIQKLKVRLATDKNLTENAKEAIRQTILNKEQKLQQELDKLSEEELKKEVENRQKLIESRLSIVKKGSEAELNLKKQQNDQKLILDEQSLKEEERSAKADADQRLQAAIAQYGAESEQAAAARLYQLEVESDYLDRKDNLQEEHRQKNLELEQQYQQNLISLRQQAWQNEIDEMEIHNTELELQKWGRLKRMPKYT